MPVKVLGSAPQVDGAAVPAAQTMVGFALVELDIHCKSAADGVQADAARWAAGTDDGTCLGASGCLHVESQAHFPVHTTEVDSD